MCWYRLLEGMSAGGMLSTQFFIEMLKQNMHKKRQQMIVPSSGSFLGVVFNFSVTEIANQPITWH